MEELKRQIEELQAEIRRRDSIQPEDNLRFLMNQIQVDNITTSDKNRVLTILNEVRLGLVAKDDKIKELRMYIKSLKDEREVH